MVCCNLHPSHVFLIDSSLGDDAPVVVPGREEVDLDVDVEEVKI